MHLEREKEESQAKSVPGSDTFSFRSSEKKF